MEMRLCFRIHIRNCEDFVAIEWLFMESKPQAANNFIRFFFGEYEGDCDMADMVLAPLHRFYCVLG